MLDIWIYFCVIPAAAGFVLDLIFGDPRRLLHPVVIIGRLVSFFERRLLQWEKKAPGVSESVLEQAELEESAESAAAARLKKSEKVQRRQFAGGCVTAVFVVLVSTLFPVGAVYLCCQVSPWLGVAAACLLCWQMYAAKGLRRESMKVYEALKKGDMERARYEVSMIVGRDTKSLNEKGIIRAAVETVAENTSDGVIAPMFYMAIAGPAGAYFYKSVNTMDSMIGYRNEKYEYFGKCAARLDDVLNFIPARISGLLMTAAAAALPPEKKQRVISAEKAADTKKKQASPFFFSGKNALRIFLRDRKKHASPNSAQTEAACAGALGVRLAGPAVYFGVFHEKPYIGDSLREVEYEDIRRANRLMYGASAGGMGIVVICAAAAAAIL